MGENRREGKENGAEIRWDEERATYQLRSISTCIVPIVIVPDYFDVLQPV